MAGKNLLHRVIVALKSNFTVLAVLTSAFFGLLSLAAFPATSAAAISQLPFAAQLTTSAGANVPDGNYSIVFKLYTQATGGASLWSETQTVTVTRGEFAAYLGSVNPFAGVDFSQSPLYLGFTVGTDPEMTPRYELGSVPSALNASALDGLDASGFFQKAQNQTVSGNTTFSGTTSFTGATSLNGAVAIQPAALSGDALTVNSASGFTGNLLDLKANGTTELTVNQNGNVLANGSLTVNNGATITAGGLSVTGGANITGNTVVTGGLTVTGITTTGQVASSGQYTNNFAPSDPTQGWAIAAQGAALNTPNTSLVALGNGAFDGTTTGHFAGAAAGTILGVNTASSFGGNLVDYQVAGVSEFSASSTGKVTTANTLTILSGGLAVNGGGITATGNSTITGTLGGLTGLTVVSGGASITGTVAIAGGVTQTGGASNSFSGATSFTQASGIGLSVTSDASVGGTLLVTSTINGATISGGSLSSTAVNGLSVAFGTVSAGTWQGTQVAVPYGGTGSTSFTSDGVIYGNGSSALQVTSAGTSGQILVANVSGVPTFVSVSSDATIAADGTLTIANGAVTNAKLAHSSLTVTAGTGLSGGGSVALGSSVTLNNTGVLSITGTTNQVNASGSTGDITLSLPQSIATTSTPTFGGLTTNGALTVASGGASITGGLNNNAGGITAAGAISGVTTISTSSTINGATISGGTLSGGSLSASAVNGMSVSGGVVTSGTWQGSIIGVQYGGTGIGSYTAGDIPYANGTSSLTKLGITGTTNLCLVSNGTAPYWGSCATGTLTSTLQQAYDSGRTITTSDNRDLDITLAKGTTTDSNFNVTVDTGSTSQVAFVRADGAGTADPSELVKIENQDTDRILPIGLKIQSAAGGISTAIDVSNPNIVTGLALGASNISGTNFGVAGSTGVVTAGGLSTAGNVDAASYTLGGFNINTAGTLSNVAYLNQIQTFSAAQTITASGTALTVNGNGNVTGTLLIGSGATVTAGGLAVNAGGISVTGNSTITGSLTGLTGLTVASGGASITGGLNNNAGGITGAGSIAGATSINASGTITGGTLTDGTLSVTSGAVTGGTTAVFGTSVTTPTLYGGTTSGGNLTLQSTNSGTKGNVYFNGTSAYIDGSSNFFGASLNVGTGTVTSGLINGQTISSAASFTGTVTAATGLTATTGGLTVSAGGAAITGNETLSGNLLPDATNTRDIGGSSDYYNNGYITTLHTSGIVSSGSSTFNAPVTVTSATAPQLTLKYDNSNYTTTSVSSAGAVTFDATGSSASFTFNKSLTANVFNSSGVTLTGGSIDGVAIGGTTPASGAFTSLSANNGLTVSSGSLSLPSGSVANGFLANSSLTVTAGTNLSGGGLVALGSSTTINVVSNPTFSGLITGQSGLTISGGGASITGGLNNNTGGITGAGAISGASSIANSGAYTQTGSSANTFTGGVTNSASGAASTPAEVLSGAIYTGGTGTTTFPQFLIQPSGATAATNWNTAGTALGINTGTFSGNLADLKVNGTSELKLDASGNLTIAGGLTTSSTGTVGFWSRSGTTISPSNAGDAITTSGNISTTSTGTITSAGLLTGSNGLAISTGAVNITGTSGALALSGLGASSINTGSNNITITSGNINTTGTGINGTAIGATTASTGAFTNLSSTLGTTLASSSGNTAIGNGTGTFALTSTGLNISTAGALTGVSTIATSGAINGQTISSTAIFTGTVTVATGETITAGGLTVSAGGASINGGLNNNAGGITGAGSIAGATTINASSTITGGTLTDGTASETGGNITGVGSLTANTITLQGSGATYTAETIANSNATSLGSGIFIQRVGGNTQQGILFSEQLTPAEMGALNGSVVRSAGATSQNVDIQPGVNPSDGSRGIITNTLGGFSLGLGNFKTTAKLNVSNGSFTDALYYNGSTYTNDTTAAKTTGSTAYTVLASTSDDFYIGQSGNIFGALTFNVTQAAVATGFVAQYWNGSAWTSLTMTDGTNGLTQSGVISFATPSAWAATTVNGIGGSSNPTWWVRFAFTGSVTTAAKANLVTPEQLAPLDIALNAGDSTASLAVETNGNVAIGTNTAASTLTVHSASAGTVLAVRNTADSGNVFTIDNTGAVVEASGLTISAGGASITGGINNNTGGVTNTGSIAGATSITASGTTQTNKLLVTGNASAGAWTVNGIALQTAASTYTDTSSSGTVASNVANSFGQPTFAANSATTYTDAATVYIAGAPVASTNVTQTNSWAFLVASGNTKLGGSVTVASVPSNVASYQIGSRDSNTNTGNSTYSVAALQEVANPGSSSGGNFVGLAIDSGTASSSASITGNLIGLLTGVNNRSANTISNASAINVATPANGGGGTITKDYGITINSQTAAGIGTAYGLYQSGSSDLNFFAGSVGILTNNPSAALSVGSSNQFQVNSSGAIAASTGIATSGAITDSAAGAASASAQILSGAIYTGGTGTTNFPQFLIQPAGATAATNWNTAGTALGINTGTFTGNLADLKVNGTTELKLDASGNLTINGGLTTSSTGTVGFWSRSGTTISPSNAGDAVTTSGNISTSSTGTITSAGLLTGSNGLTVTTGAVNITGTSGALALSGLGASSVNTGSNALTITASNINTTGTGINGTAIGATTASTGAFTTLSATGTSTVVAINASGAYTQSGSGANTFTGSTTISSGAGANTTIGNATGTFGLTSTGLNVTTAGALSGITTIGTSGAINGQTISSAASFTGTLTVATSITAPILKTASGALSLQAASGVVSLNQSGVNNSLQLNDASGNTTSITANSGELQLNGTGTNQVIIGDVGSPENLIFQESSTIGTSGSKSLAFGLSGDTFNLNQSGVTYNIGTLNSTGVTLATSSTSTTALVVNGPTSMGANLLDLQVNGTSQFNVTSGGSIGKVANITASGQIVDSTTGANALALSGVPGTSASVSLLQLGSAIASGSANGTFIGVNAASGYTGDLVDLQVNGSPVFKIASSGAVTNAASGAASTPAELLSGAIYTGGTGTTNFPQVLLQPTGATAATNWNTAGTALGINTGTFTGNLADLKVNGTSELKLDASGNLTIAGGLTTSSTGTVGFWSRSGTTISPSNAGDAVTTSGNISTTSTGTVTSAGLLTGSNGLTVTTGAVNITGTSGALALSGLGASSINVGSNALTITASNINTTGTGINGTAIGATTASTAAFTTLSATGTSTVVAINATGGYTQSGSSANTFTGSTTISSGAGANTTIGNGTGTFGLTSTGLNVTTAGALSGITTIVTSGTINGQTIGSASSFTGTVAVNTSLTVPLIQTSSGNLSLQSASGIVSLNTSGVNNVLNIYGTGGTNYAQITDNGTNAQVTTNSGELQLSGGNGSNNVTIGDVGSAANLIFQESSTIGTSGSKSLAFGLSGDTFNLNQAGVTYNVGTLNSTGVTLTTSSTSTTALVVNGPTSMGANLLDLQVNGTSQFNVTSGGSIGKVAGITASGQITDSTTGGNALALTGAPGASATASLLQLGSALVSGSGNGTFIGVNAASGYAGDLVNLQVNGASVFKVAASGAVTNLAAGAASTPSELLSGAIYTGGTGTTTFPQFLIQPTGATAATNWNTAGTAFGINTGTFTGNLADLKVNGTTELKLDASGNLTIAGGLTTSSTGTVGFWSRASTTISPSNSGDAITTSGNISTSSTGTITSAGLLTGSNGLTVTTGAVNLTGTSGALALSGLGASSINVGANALTITASNINTTGSGINGTAIGATTTATGAFTSLASTIGTTLASSSGNVAIGNGSGTFALTSSGGLNVTTSGALSGISTIITSSTINSQTISATASFSGTVAVATSETVPTVIGSSSSGGTLTLSSTSNSTKGKILLGSSSAYDEANVRLGIGTTSPSQSLQVTDGNLNFTQVSAPGTPPSGVDVTGGGSLSAGNYQYSVTYADAYGETTGLASAAVPVSAGDRITVTIPVSSDSAVTARKLYRTQVGGFTYTLVATIANNTATSYTDGASDVSIASAAIPPVENKTGGLIMLAGSPILLVGSSNTVLGQTTFVSSNTTGLVNVGVGVNVLALNSTGVANAAFGGYALSSNTTGQYNTGLGGWALQNNTTGQYNSAVGTLALSNNTTGSTNVAVGKSALSVNITGSNNVAVGSSSLLSNLLGQQNTVVGASADLTVPGTFSAAAASGAGLGTGNYNYIVTFMLGSQESVPSWPTLVTTTGGNDKVNLSGLPTYSGPWAGSISRKIYRTIVNGGTSSTFALVATIADNTTTTYADTTADGSLGATISPNSSDILLGYGATTLFSNQFVVGSTASAITDAYFGKGLYSTTPGSFTLHATGGSGSNIGGGNLVVAPGQGTGTQAGGNFIVQVAPAGLTGSTFNSNITALTVAPSGASAAVSVAGTLAVSSTSTFSAQVIVSSGGASITGGIANNAGGITGAGSVAGVTSIANSGGYTQTGSTANTFTGATTLSGAVVDSAAGGASTPAEILTGAIYAAGTGTTTFPQFLIQPTGATAATNWSTNGTALGINTGTFTGNLADLKVNGTSQFTVTATGNATIGNNLTVNGTGTSTFAGTIQVSTLTASGALAITSGTNSAINITPNGSGNINATLGTGTLTVGDGGTTNYAAFSNAGALTFNGSARPYAEIDLIPENAVVPGSGNCTINQTDDTATSYKTMDCPASVDDSGDWQFKVPQNYVNGTNVQVDVTWEDTAGTSTTTGARFDLTYVSVPVGSTFKGATGTTVTGSVVNSSGQNQTNDSLVTLTAPSVNANDQFSLKVLRKGTVDTLVDTAKVIEVRLKFLVNS